METTNKKLTHDDDKRYIDALRNGDNNLCRKFFYGEIGGTLMRIRAELFHGRVEADELVNELYLYLSGNSWAKLDGFDGRNGCRLRTWMIPVAWRYFLSIRERMLTDGQPEDAGLDATADDDLRIQIAIDVKAVLDRMTNRRYAEILRLLLIEGYTAPEVAQMLGIRIQNVYNLKHRAILSFMELYGKR